MSPEVAAHLTEIISVLRREWLYRDTMDWGSFRRRVFERAGSATVITESHGAIRHALALLGDRHGSYTSASGQMIYSPQSPTQSTGKCMPVPLALPRLPVGIGYIRIRITPQTPATTIQAVLRDGSRIGIDRWIVDLRNSRGGNMWPALAGIGSLLGDGVAGFFVDAAGRAIPWGYTKGRAWSGPETKTTLENPVTFLNPNSRVAVLTDIGVASSGEAIAIAFRSRPNTRSFGTATCGLSTSVSGFRLAGKGTINVVVGVMADRTMKRYGGPVDPDEVITDPNRVVPRAIEWLLRK